MSDTGLPRGGDEPETHETNDESTSEAGELQILAEGIADPESGDDLSATAPADEHAMEEPAGSASEFTLDELVAEMAGVSSVTAQAPAVESAPAPEHVDPLTAAMSDTFAEAAPTEAALWTRVPFWVIGLSWMSFVGVMTFLLWPKSSGGLQDAPLYGALVFGGAGLVVLSLFIGLIVWARARSHAEAGDRGIVSRAVLLRVLGWTAGGVALWVVALIVLSLRHLDVF